MSLVKSFYFCDDLVTEIIRFQPHWDLAFINHQWYRAWRTYIRRLRSLIKRDLYQFMESKISGMIFSHLLVSDRINSDMEHQRCSTQNQKLAEALLPRGVDPSLFDHCTICHQELSHSILREYSLLFGCYEHETVFHLISSPLQISSLVDLSRNDPCQYLIGKYVICAICVNDFCPEYLTVTSFSAP